MSVHIHVGECILENTVAMSEGSEKPTCTTKNAACVENAPDNLCGVNFQSSHGDNANSSCDDMIIPRENPVDVPETLMQGQNEVSATIDTIGNINGKNDGSKLSHFISDGKVCSFLKSALGIDTAEKFASADRFHVAQRLFSWYEERAAKEGDGGVATSCQARPLKVLEAQVFSWQLQMNKIRANHGLTLLSASGHLAPVARPSVGNTESVCKEPSASTAESQRADSNESGSANTRKMPSSDAGDKRPKKIQELLSKKESTAATNVLSGIDDLLTVLPQEQCRFLGNKFWIFTVQQLETVLLQGGTSTEETKLESTAPLRVRKYHLVEAIIKEMTKVAESSSDSSDRIVPNREVTEIEKRNTSAEALISSWKTKLDARRKPSPDDVLQSFPLYGAVSILIPPALIQFLKTVGIDSAYDLISARKTENSFLVALFNIWQEKQGMKTSRPQNVARFLTSVSSRLQSAITSVAPADSFTRAWSESNLITLTSSAREFIVFYCRYSDDDSFLEEQTGNIAKKLGSFRAKKGMPVLKGTGNVAVVSSWRTMVKDTADIRESLRRPLRIVDLDIEAIFASRNNGLGNMSKNKVPVSNRGRREKISSASVAVQRANAVPRSDATLKPQHDHLSDDINLVMHELQSNDFMRRVLKKSQGKFLQSAGISNADQLLRADKSEKSAIVQRLIRWRRDRGFDEIPAVSASKAIVDWSGKVEAELNAVKQKRRRDLETENEVVILKNDSAGKRSGGSDKSRQTKKKQRAIPKKFLGESGLDPIEALGPTAREFLSTLGVFTAEEFLSKTTADLGSAFIAWRARTGLDVLKGAGAISIVSGWKGQVRDVCEYLGKQSLIDLDAMVRKKSLSGNGSATGFSGGTTSWKDRLSQLAQIAPSRSSETSPGDKCLDLNVLDKPEDRFVSRPGVLNGLSSRNFTVRGDGKGKCVAIPKERISVAHIRQCFTR